jgi:hypothetical protein
MFDLEVEVAYQTTGFPALRRLSISGDLICIATFFGCISSDKLEYVEICSEGSYWEGLDYMADISNWRKCLEDLVSNIRVRDSLRHICGSVDSLSRDHSDVFGAEFVLEPLLALRNLEVVRFCQDFHYMFLSDQDVQAMALAWPMITQLELPQMDGVIRPTFASLQCLAHHCPRLTRLSLSIDFRSIPAGTVSFSSHGLQTLNMGTSILDDDLKSMQTTLQNQFPRLNSVLPHGQLLVPLDDDSMEDTSGWN